MSRQFGRVVRVQFTHDPGPVACGSLWTDPQGLGNFLGAFAAGNLGQNLHFSFRETVCRLVSGRPGAAALELVEHGHPFIRDRLP